ncbi:hypothetical protein [Streptomyces sp. NPDC051098]|uniref:hypothetical protein n=1 Tax=Streptomyces sp. NPDC051098 TaxID=3155411 RepID=UPI00342D9FF5
MTFRHATVLGSAGDARRISEQLRAAGADVGTWILPEELGAGEAAAIALKAGRGGEWTDRLAGTEITVTVCRNPEILVGAVVPYVLPQLPIGSVWLQMGRTSDDERERLADAAADHEIGFLCAGPRGEPAQGLAARWTIPRLFAREPFLSAGLAGEPGDLPPSGELWCSARGPAACPASGGRDPLRVRRSGELWVLGATPRLRQG